MADQTKSQTDAQGSALNGERLVEILCLALVIAYALLLAKSLAQGLWIVDRSGAPVNADFSVFWGAGRLVRDGHASAAYHWGAVRAAIEHMSGKPFPPGGDYPFFYPPSMLLYVAPLGFLPYAPAAALWIAVTLGAYLATARAILPRRSALLIAAASPAALWCVCVGQNGLLSAALFGGALVLLDRRKIAAGGLLALLTFKPQLGVLIPLVLIATGRWRIFAWASVWSGTLALLAGLAFGFDIYVPFLQASGEASHRLLVAGNLPWFKMQSIYGFARTLDLAPQMASVLQAGFTVVLAIAVIALWRSRARYNLKAAGLAAAALAISPYSLIYDFPIATIAILFLIADGDEAPLALWQKLALAAAFLTPLAFNFTSVPVGPAVYLLLPAVISARVWRDLSPAGASDTAHANLRFARD